MTDDNFPTMTPEEADGALFGPTGMESIAKPVSIRLLWADKKQPRRIFPREVRGDWEGSPQRVPELLRKWHQLVVDQYGEVDAGRLVLGNTAMDLTHESAIVNDYFQLCQLAAGIVYEGLTNAITITIAHGGFFNIETGERRWLAHYLLVMYGGNRFDKIMARVVDKFNIYRQASENAAREPLNAVATARQLALILIDIHRHKHIENWETCVPPGHCDRNYYIQATNLDIIRGDGARVLAATGIKNRSMFSRYKAILTLPDELWLQADEENWTENRCRQALEGLRQADELERQKETDWIESMEEDETQPDQVDDVLPVGNKGFDIDGVHYSDDLDFIQSQTRDDDDLDYALSKIPDANESLDIQAGDRVELPGGAIVEIIMLTSDDNGVPMIRYKKDSGGQFNEYLEKIVMVGRNTVVHPVASVDDDEYPDHYDPFSYVKALVEVGDLLEDDELNSEYVVDQRINTPKGVHRVILINSINPMNDELDAGVWVKYDGGGGGFFRYDQISHVDDNQESGADYVEPYVPETNQDAMPAINTARPALGKLISALCAYYYDCPGEYDADIPFALDDLLKSDGQISKDQKDDWGGVDPYRVRMREIKKVVRLYLEQVSRDINDWTDAIVSDAEGYHLEYWGED